MNHLKDMQNYTQDDFPLQEEIFSVKALNLTTRSMLERQFQNIWVKGELSNLAQPRSGHLYFTLKDADAQIRCAMFRGAQRGINFELQDGIEVIVQANVSLYVERGDYQLIVSKMKVWGEGQLQQAFEALKKKLEEAELFAEEHKKVLPVYPNHIGIISSDTGDAVQDILRILKERYPIAPITIYPTQVQGKQAAPSIIKAIGLANKHAKADVLILARGGGSLEDLWGFNEEKVAKAIFKSKLPIVTGIGHQMDFTIADFVADVRAPTPTAAAQTIVPDQAELAEEFSEYQAILAQVMQRFLDHKQLNLDHIEKRLENCHPKAKLNQNAERLVQAQRILAHLIQQRLIQSESLLQQRMADLMQQNPTNQIQLKQQILSQKSALLSKATLAFIQNSEQKLAHLAEQLQTLSPLNTLSRGFAVVTDSQTHKPIQKISQIKAGQTTTIKLQDGEFDSVVATVRANKSQT